MRETLGSYLSEQALGVRQALQARQTLQEICADDERADLAPVDRRRFEQTLKAPARTYNALSLL